MNVKKFLNTKSGRLLVAAVLGAGVLVGVTVAANGAVKPDCKSLSYPLCPRSVAATQVVDNSLPASKIVPADRNAFLKDTDVYGKSGVAKDFDPVAIAKIGGSFKTNKTKVGEFSLQPGTWLLNSTAFFARTTAGAPGTRPQLALRVGASDTAFGTDYGTILGAEISPAKDRELTGATVKIVTVAKATTVEVFAFGYNDDGSAAGGGEITASASVAAVRVG
ncbi:hypothetical protein ACFWUU_02930 [Kribbella sp. NPDC058693]|uniref:Uncharacterized protein n=1 Tax=Kribbella jiaozuonensis TaxID=2575441 RepID=A0A4U3LT42_9ACTN|nr:hypothetical protein [Kribbella jiaozuonensis]TKK79185.1 hypothetical protein FDA38_12200 [Kribbella jiaozuonensis]TKK83255.1 hypothetical protein FDA38_11155 [Kribbella jiaozuonensis]